ncbi:MAG: rhomboid family intramembrane serine protease [Solirubrobacteraceae bacterium]
MATPVDALPVRSRSEDRVRGFVFVGAMVIVMWVVEVLDAAGAHLDANGIHPRDPGTLPDIAFAPFLHSGWGHLIGNTIPFLILGGAIALSGLARTAAVTVLVAAIGGLGTWLIGPAHTNHIGASGLVFGFAAYLIARGLFSRNPIHLVAGVGVIAVYGATLAFSLVPHPGISWQGHLFGAVGGIVAARVLNRKRRPAAV